MNDSVRRRSRVFSRSRSLLIGAVVLIVILVIQMVTSIVGAVIAQRQATDAAQDTFAYVGDLTAERVARYAAAAQEMVDATTILIEDADSLEYGEVVHLLHLNLSRVPQVRGAYVGFPDGRTVTLAHEGTGYTSIRVEVDPEYRVTRTTYDENLFITGAEMSDLVYDPRTRPWYMAGENAAGAVWTQPYLLFESNVTYASVARAAHKGVPVIAVTGADVNVNQMTTILDALPLGAGAEAFVLSPDRRVIAAPAAYTDRLLEVATATGEVPFAEDIGLLPPVDAVNDGDGNTFSEVDGRIILERGFEPEEGLDWILHLEADKNQLSPGLDRLQVTVYTITAFSALMVFAVAVLMYRMWRPLRRLNVDAHTDQLTGLSNRHEYRSRGRKLLQRAEARDEVMAVVVFDVDNFKALNDELGHDAGDIALTIVGDALAAASRESDAVARLGGDEFVLMQVVTDIGSVPKLVERIRSNVEHTVRMQAPGGEGLGLTAGYSLTQPHMFDLDILMARADAALIQGKRIAKGTTYGYERPADVV